MDEKSFAARNDWMVSPVMWAETPDYVKLAWFRTDLYEAVLAMNELYEDAGPA